MGEMIQFGKYFSNGLKPPTRLALQYTMRFISNQRAVTDPDLRNGPWFSRFSIRSTGKLPNPNRRCPTKNGKNGTFSYGFPGKLLFLGGGNSNIFGIFIPTWGILTNIFQMGWNHQLVFILIIPHSICIFPSQVLFCLFWLPNEL